MLITIFFIRIPDLRAQMNTKQAGQIQENSPGWLRGYHHKISGEEIQYNSPIPQVNRALLVRATDGKMAIEWQTQTIPENPETENVTFVWLAGLGSNWGNKKFNMFINQQPTFVLQTTKKSNWEIKSAAGYVLRFESVLKDQHGDLFGFMYLQCPCKAITPGRALQIRLEGEAANSRAWIMMFMSALPSQIVLKSEQAISIQNGQFSQLVNLDIVHIGLPTSAQILISDARKIEMKVKPGSNSIQIPFKAVTEETSLAIQIQIANRPIQNRSILLKPVSKRAIYLLPHSHNDIGYTELQTEVERKQWDHLRKAMQLAEKTANYPSGAQFKWNVEILWAVDGYLKQASPAERVQFIEAIKKGWIGLQALYANELTGLCRPEELFQLMDFSRKLQAQYAVKINSAMITDIPGYAWGIVPALVQNGVKYFSSGPNYMPLLPNWGDRIGYTLKKWGDRPFYWLSPSGKEKLLIWVAGRGYSLFHGGNAGSILNNGTKTILDYMNQLAEMGYPYEMVQLRYTIGGDNGPPDEYLSDFVKEWNAKYESPKIIIATSDEMFTEFERRYGDNLPVVKGDFTPYWEDGAASSARETALARNAAEQLIQAETLWTLLNPSAFPFADFENAWRNVLLFNEHTWGAYNSISAPDDPFALGQWQIKQAFALDAEKQSIQLRENALNTIRTQSGELVKVLDIFNTNSWTRTDLIQISGDIKLAGELVRDELGNSVPAQRLSTGDFVFLAQDVEPLGAKRYFLQSGKPFSSGIIKIDADSLQNEQLKIKLNQKTGAIESLKRLDLNVELVDLKENTGLNEFFYVPGMNPATAERVNHVKITTKESGPLVGTLRIESEAPGCQKLTREIRMTAGTDYLEIIDVIDRKKVREKEGVHLAFPFNIPEGTIHMDLGWGIIRPEADQIAGACKNHFSVQRWVDISNQDYGVTWVSLDAPLVEVGGITAEVWNLSPDRPWIKYLPPSQTIYSYVMNNYWHTNYKADQEGLTTFRYAIRPHCQFRTGEASHFGMERSQPLIAVPVDGNAPPLKSFMKIEPATVILTSLKTSNDGQSRICRLFNASGSPQQVILNWTGEQKPTTIFRSSPREEQGLLTGNRLEMLAWEILTLRCECK
jgi:hypothetical protein